MNVLPTAVAYPRYAYLHPALPKAGDRQVAKTYFDDGAKAQKSKEWQRAKAAYLQATKSDPAWFEARFKLCLLYTSPSPRDGLLSRMPSSA